MLKLHNKLLDNKLIIFSFSIAILISFFSSTPILPLIIILILFLTYFFKHRVILLIIIISYLTITNEYFEQYRIYISLSASILLAVLFLQKFGFQTKKYVKVPGEILYFLVLLFLTLVVSTIFSAYPLKGLIIIVRMFFFFIICYLFYGLLKDEKNVYAYIYSICFVMLILGTRILIDLYNLGIEGYFIRGLLTEKSELYSSLRYTSLTIFFISVSLITAMFFLNRFNKTRQRTLLIVLLFFNIAIQIFANSRGGIAASILSIIFILIVLKRSLLFKIFSSATIVTIILLFTIPGMPDIADIYLRWNTLNDREVYWQAGIDVIKNFPVFGLGPDLFDKYFYSYAPSNTFNYLKTMGTGGTPHPHNFFLYFTAENGILGLITSIVFFILFFYFAFKTMQITKKIHNDYFILSTAITGIGIAIFFRSFIEVTGFLTYGYITTDLPFWLVFGILISIYQKFKDLPHTEKM